MKKKVHLFIMPDRTTVENMEKVNEVINAGIRDGYIIITESIKHKEIEVEINGQEEEIELQEP